MLYESGRTQRIDGLLMGTRQRDPVIDSEQTLFVLGLVEAFPNISFAASSEQGREALARYHAKFPGLTPDPRLAKTATKVSRYLLWLHQNRYVGRVPDGNTGFIRPSYLYFLLQPGKDALNRLCQK